MNKLALEDRIAALENQAGMGREPVAKPLPRQTIATEIDELEQKINAMSYMDEDDMTYMDDMDDMEEVAMDDIEIYSPMVDEATVVDEIGEVVEPAMDADEEAYCGDYGMNASETRPGVEDRITQDYLSDVQGEEHGEELATDGSMLDAAPTGYKASEEYVSHLKSASARLDRVANYLQKHGRVELATRIDRIADVIDSNINGRVQ